MEKNLVFCSNGNHSKREAQKKAFGFDVCHGAEQCAGICKPQDRAN